MKKILIIALVLFGLGACTQRTCPTYADNDAAESDTQEVSAS